LATHFRKNGKRRRYPQTISYLLLADTSSCHFVETATKFGHERICILMIRHDGHAIGFPIVFDKKQSALLASDGLGPVSAVGSPQSFNEMRILQGGQVAT
jgi:hypothetical protein